MHIRLDSTKWICSLPSRPKIDSTQQSKFAQTESSLLCNQKLFLALLCTSVIRYPSHPNRKPMCCIPSWHTLGWNTNSGVDSIRMRISYCCYGPIVYPFVCREISFNNFTFVSLPVVYWEYDASSTSEPYTQLRQSALTIQCRVRKCLGVYLYKPSGKTILWRLVRCSCCRKLSTTLQN